MLTFVIMLRQLLHGASLHARPLLRLIGTVVLAHEEMSESAEFLQNTAPNTSC